MYNQDSLNLKKQQDIVRAREEAVKAREAEAAAQREAREKALTGQSDEMQIDSTAKGLSFKDEEEKDEMGAAIRILSENKKRENFRDKTQI